MESIFGADFSDVRVYVGPQAGRIGADAMTSGTSIFFAPGRYDPVSAPGRRLIAHELAHVVQQKQGRVQSPAGVGLAIVRDPALEAEADRFAQRAMVQHDPFTSQRGAPPAPRGGLSAVQPHRIGPPGAIQRMYAGSFDWDKKVVVRPNSPRATGINNASGSKWDSMNTTMTVTFSSKQQDYGQNAVFSLTNKPESFNEAGTLNYDSVTYRGKSDEHLHAEMLLLKELLLNKISESDIRRIGISRRMCKYCGMAFAACGLSVTYDANYEPTNWTNPWKAAGYKKSQNPNGLPWQ